VSASLGIRNLDAALVGRLKRGAVRHRQRDPADHPHGESD
jgi:hypothetical protein